MTIVARYIGRGGDWHPLSGSGTIVSPRGGADSTAPADWQTAWDSNDYDTLRAWYVENTGPSGTLTPSGSVDSSFAGQVIENLDVSGRIRVLHDNVTVRNCRISGHNRNTGHVYVAYADRDVVNSWTVEDCLMIGDDPIDIDDDGDVEAAGYAIGATYASVTIRRCRGTNSYSGFRLSNNGNDLVEYSMVDTIIRTPPDHNTGSSFRGGDGVRYIRNWIEGSSSSALSLYPDQAPITDMTAEENLFDGGTYSILGGDGKTYSDQTNHIRFLNNKFTYDYQYGPRSSYSLTATGNQWLGNVHLEDGTLAGSEVNNASSTAPPVASFTMTPPSPVESGTTITFDASGSTGADTYEWDDAVDINDPVVLGEWPLGTGSVLNFTFQSPGTKAPRLTVTNPEGVQDSAIQELTVTETTVNSVPSTAPSPSGTVTSATSIRWSWTTVDTATGYKIRLDSGTWADVGNELQHDDTGLVEGVSRTFEVLAYNSVGDGPASAPISRTPQAVSGGETQMLSSVTQHDITWTFDGTYEVGQYVNGDYWVLGPLNIIGISPSSVSGTRESNGSMINPSPNDGTSVGYDSDISDLGYSATKNVALDVSSSSPLVVPTSSSLVSTISVEAADSRPGVDTAAVLTVVDQAPPANSFRPPYSGTNKTAVHNVADVAWGSLSNLGHVAGTLHPTVLAEEFDRVWLDHVPGYNGRSAHPVTSMPDYGRNLASLLGKGFLTLLLDFTTAEKEQLVINLIQIGIDLYGVAMDGGENNWVPNGGHAQGRKLPILFAGKMLGDTAMANIGQNNTIFFGEDAQTFYIDADTVTVGTGYDSSMIGTPEWGIRHATDPSRDDASWGASYRQCCTTNSWHGHVLFVQQMGWQTDWNYNALFDYTHRHMAHFGVGTLARTYDDFSEEMWDTYA